MVNTMNFVSCQDCVQSAVGNYLHSLAIKFNESPCSCLLHTGVCTVCPQRNGFLVCTHTWPSCYCTVLNHDCPPSAIPPQVCTHNALNAARPEHGYYLYIRHPFSDNMTAGLLHLWLWSVFIQIQRAYICRFII